MIVFLNGTPKEIADLVSLLQSQQKLELVHDSTQFMPETAEGVLTEHGPSVSRTC